MRSLYKIALAVLAVGFLVVAGSAFAQDQSKPQLQIVGDVSSSFGQVSWGATNTTSSATKENKAYSELYMGLENNTTLKFGNDSLNGFIRYRFRFIDDPSGQDVNNSGAPTPVQGGGGKPTTGSGNQTNINGNGVTQAGAQGIQSSANILYGEIHWAPVSNLDIGFGNFQAKEWSNPLAGIYESLQPVSVVQSTISGTGKEEYYFNWDSVPALDATYNLGAMRVGLAVSNTCQPGCNQNASANLENAMTIAPHFFGTFGDITVAAHYDTASATAVSVRASSGAPVSALANNESAVGVSGSGYQLGVAWAGMPGVRVAADMVNTDEAKITGTNATNMGLVGAFAQQTDKVQNSYDLRIDAFGVSLFHFEYSNNNFLKKVGAFAGSEQGLTVLRYTLAVSPVGRVTFEYRDAQISHSVVNGNAIAGAVDNSSFNIGGKVLF